MKNKFKFEINFDYDSLLETLFLLHPYIKKGMMIDHYERVGPGGGNPAFVFSFPDKELLYEFRKEYDHIEFELDEEYGIND